MASPLIIWDLDEVLVNLREITCQKMRGDFGWWSDWNKWTSYQGFHRNFTNAAGRFPDEDEFWNAMIASNVLELAEPEEGARGVLAALSSDGFRQVIVSARGWHPNGLEITWNWLKSHGLAEYFSEVYLTDLHGKKSDIIKNMGAVSIYVDDGFHHLEDAAESCECVDHLLLLNRPWNQGMHSDDIIRIGKLSAVPCFGAIIGGG